MAKFDAEAMCPTESIGIGIGIGYWLWFFYVAAVFDGGALPLESRVWDPAVRAITLAVRLATLAVSDVWFLQSTRWLSFVCSII